VSPSLTFDKINKGKFKIMHTQASVDYCITAFKIKNQDKINDEIMDVVVKLFDNTMKDQTGKTILSKFTK
jgi:myosin heavy subunit